MTNEVVLIVEDEFLIGVSVRDWLEGAGFRTIGPVMTAAEALSVIDARGCDVAIVDLKLGDGPAEAVARKLSERGIPFAAFTGYPAEGLPAEYAGAPVVPKPCQAAEVIGTLRTLLDGKGRKGS
jgi:DNA-binding response OmpR family regulator